jgi:hypothetical protein
MSQNGVGHFPRYEKNANIVAFKFGGLTGEILLQWTLKMKQVDRYLEFFRLFKSLDYLL